MLLSPGTEVQFEVNLVKFLSWSLVIVFCVFAYNYFFWLVCKVSAWNLLRISLIFMTYVFSWNTMRFHIAIFDVIMNCMLALSIAISVKLLKGNAMFSDVPEKKY